MAKVCVRHVNIVIASLTQPQTQVNIVVGHLQVVRVEAADLSVTIRTHDETCSRHGSNFVRELGATEVSEFAPSDSMVHMAGDRLASQYNTSML